MIEIEKEKVTLSRDIWDRLRNDSYFDELIQNILDSEAIIDAMENDNDFMEIREYDKLRKERQV